MFNPKQHVKLIWCEKNLLSECFNFHFPTQYLGCPNNLKYMKTSVILRLSMSLLGHLIVIQS